LQVIGTDLDDASNALGLNEGRDIAMSGLPELRRGGFAVICSVIFAQPQLDDCDDDEETSSQTYRNAEEAYHIGQDQLDYYRQLAEEPGISLIRSRQDLEEVLMAWEHTQEDDDERPLGLIPLMEGAEPIRSPLEVAEWFNNGLRIVALAWSNTRYSGSNSHPGPLTTSGKALLREMERVGMILDTTHLAEESFWQALKHFNGPVIASHSNCRTLTMSHVQMDELISSGISGQRHLSDEQIHALIERDAVIGVVPFNSFLDATWSRDYRFDIGLDLMVRHIDHICQLAGDAKHVALGSDIDGGFGRFETPSELDTVADLQKLAQALRVAGYQEKDVRGVMGGNWHNLFARALPDAPADDVL
jgi:membrane dipeptidase